VNLTYAQWTQTTTRPDQPGKAVRVTFWLRANPPTLAWRTEDGGYWSLDVIDGRGRWHTDSNRVNCLLYPASPLTAEALARRVVAPEPPSGPVFEESLDSLAVRPVFLWTGLRRALRYDWDVIRGNFRVRYTVWVERKTRRLIRKEKREFNLLTGREFSLEVHDRYLYNRKPPPDAFEMPPGRPTERHDPETNDAPPVGDL
jgi:hypothetical protein